MRPNPQLQGWQPSPLTHTGGKWRRESITRQKYICLCWDRRCFSGSIPTSAALLKLHFQRFSIADDLELCDAGQSKKNERFGKPQHFPLSTRPSHLAAHRAANVGKRGVADADIDRIAFVRDRGFIADIRQLRCEFGGIIDSHLLHIESQGYRSIAVAACGKDRRRKDKG